MNSNGLNYKKIYFKGILIVVLLLTLFYWAAGEQLYFKASMQDREEMLGNCSTQELVSGAVVRQEFVNDATLIKKIGVLLTNNGKQVDSDVKIYLEDVATGQVLASQIVNAADIGVNEFYYLELDEGISGFKGATLAIILESENGTLGNSAVSVYDNSQVSDRLMLDGEEVSGTLSYVFGGLDSIWVGQAYIYIALSIVVLLSAAYWTCVYRHTKGKREPIFSTYDMLQRYQFLIEQIVNRDFKVKYKRSVLGVFWSFLNPLMMMIVQYIVFSNLFRSDIDNFPVYLLSGTVLFNFFNEAVGLSMTSIIGNATLITKVYVPKYIYPVTRVLSSLVNLLMSLIPLLITIAITGEQITKAYLLFPLFVIFELIFTVGVGMMLSALMVFFRDIQFLWSIVSMLWTYMTPLFYPETIIPERFRFIHTLNPMYYFIKGSRMILMEGISPEPQMYVLCAVISFATLFVGAYIFKKTQDQFAINI